MFCMASSGESGLLKMAGWVAILKYPMIVTQAKQKISVCEEQRLRKSLAWEMIPGVKLNGDRARSF